MEKLIDAMVQRLGQELKGLLSHIADMKITPATKKKIEIAT